MAIQTIYTLTFSDPNKTETIIVPGSPSGSGKNNYDTSLDLVGPGYISYGQSILQNFVKVLENFAGPNPPRNAIQGQLWYDTSNPERKILRINNGELSSARWPSANGIYQQPNDPTKEYLQQVRDGDIWVNTSNNQLSIRNGNEWILVGPSTSALENKTGVEVVELESVNGPKYPVILNWVDGKVVEVISYHDFTPRVVIDGFSTLKVGINLTNKVFAKFNGLADRANSLEVSKGVVVKASEILKNKIASNARQTHTGTFVVESMDGLSVKRNSLSPELKMYADANRAFITFLGATTTTNNAAVMRVGLEDHSYISFRRVSQTSNQGKIGFNVSPSVLSASSSTITVNGGASFTDRIFINGPNTTTGMLSVIGAVGINGTLAVSGNSRISGKLTVANTLTTFDILPSTSTSVIGSPTAYYDYIYVKNLGSIADNSLRLYGYASYANTLTNFRRFSIDGDITSSNYDFNGSQNVDFVTSATSDLITNKELITTANTTHNLLVVDTAVPGAPLQQISKSDFLSNIIFSGMIMPFTGDLPVNLPSGWLWCNGDSYSTSTYVSLFEIAGYKYGNDGGNFKVPDMTTSTYITTGTNTGTYLQYIIKI